MLWNQKLELPKLNPSIEPLLTNCLLRANSFVSPDDFIVFSTSTYTKSITMATSHGLDGIFGYMPFDHFLVVRPTGF